ncbi:hypothetical protein AOQ84DRAFT_227677 [Glonium stellatum]|uniref:Uncharacterized protein n=1 Tax=Glonium stellatum TaxID=574774 RepID=A0A8E2ERC7_9PEZI|nr:hypothetical protein AOQ84DRAFT_227677 [Glonium stellatum]
MSSESSIDSVFQALKALQVEVCGIASKLRSAEERICRLEEATFTPSPSPNPTESSDHFSLSCCVEQTVLPCPLTRSPSTYQKAGTSSTASDIGNIQKEKSSAACASIDQQANQPSEKLGSDAVRACDLEQQLLPIKDGIANLAQHLSKIEGYLVHSTSPIPRPAASSRNSREFRDRKVSTDKQFSTNPSTTSSGSPRLKAISTPQPRQDRRDWSHVVLGHPRHKEKSPNQPSIIFGQSTPVPKKTQIRLRIEKSPFTKYAGPTSPFDRLRTENRGLTPPKA